MADLTIEITVTHAGETPVVVSKTISVPPVPTVVPHDTGTTLIDEVGKVQTSKQTVQGNVEKL